MAKIYRSQTVIGRDSNLPEDVTTFTMHWMTNSLLDPTPPSNEATAAMIVARIDTWLKAIGSVLSSKLNNTGVVKVYDMDDPEPRVPIDLGLSGGDVTFTASSGSLPSELAVCCSYQAAPASGINQGRRRGRIFVGPLSSNATDSTGSPGDVVLAGASRTILLNAFAALATPASATQPALCVLSQAAMAEGETPQQAAVRASQVWVDNAFDVQRRRGAAATSRAEANILTWPGA